MVIAFDKIFQEKKDEWVLGGFVTKVIKKFVFVATRTTCNQIEVDIV